MNKYDEYEIQKLIKSFFGSDKFSFRIMRYLFFLILILGWIPDVVSALFEKIFSEKGLFNWELSDGTMICQILILILIIICFKKFINKELPKVSIDTTVPEKAKALIIFLSDNKFKTGDIEKIKSLDDLKENNNFAMPIYAIKHHKSEKLQKIVVVCSKESIESLFNFKILVKNIFKDEGLVNALGIELVGDFENAKEIYEVLEKIYIELRKLKIKERDIVVDITGGKKIISIAGAMFAIPNDRRLEYVSTTDYSVKQYDIVYSN